MIIPRLSITINGHSIKASISNKFLEVYIDQELHFTTHAAYAIIKGIKYVLVYKQLTKVSKGVKACMAKKLYKVVMIPKMMYTIVVWKTTMLQIG
ncbi:hypothetical protein HD554DRAFT_2031981 [Boletus coccyginus]|nr:hypothetical protein HD554DRAFT_2031981 [Boletus coccyginus]